MPFVLVSHTQPKSGLTLGASYVVSPVITSGPVRLPLRPSPANLYVTFSFARVSPRKGEDRADLRFYLLLLSPHAAVLTPGPRSLRVPTASRSALAFAQNVGARRVSGHGPVYPRSPTLPAIPVGGELSRSCNVHVKLRPAASVGPTDWVSPQGSSTSETRAAIQGCRVGASSADVLPHQRALYLFSQVGNC